MGCIVFLLFTHFCGAVADFSHSGNDFFFIGNGNNIRRPKVNCDRNVLLSILTLYAVEYLDFLNERIYKRWGKFLNICAFKDIFKKRFQIDRILLRRLDIGFCLHRLTRAHSPLSCAMDK